MKPSELSSRVHFKAFPRPPSAWNPKTATRQELIRHGLPPRPDPKRQPGLSKKWDRAMARKPNFIQPAFRRIQKMSPVRGVAGLGKLRDAITTKNWSGVSIVNEETFFNGIIASWTVPNPYPVSNDGTWEYSAAWIGLGGGSITDHHPVQVGTAHHVMANAIFYEYAHAVAPRAATPPPVQEGMVSIIVTASRRSAKRMQSTQGWWLPSKPYPFKSHFLQ